MYATEVIKLVFGVYFALVCLFFIWFIIKVKKPGAPAPASEERKTGMDRRELRFFIILVLVVVLAHVVTLSKLVPWQGWLLWSKPTVAKSYHIEVSDYQFQLPEKPLTVKKGEFVEFVLTSTDVTYGFGVFRKNGTLVFQFQVLPGYKNRFVWNFAEPGYYDVRSTEYSGPRHSEMFLQDAILVVDKEGGSDE